MINEEFRVDYEPNTPLMAGRALVRPDMLYVQYSCSRAELVGRGNVGRLLREALERNQDPTASSGQVFRDVPSWAKEFAGLEAHERDHVRRLLGTSFGLLCHALRSQQLTALRSLIADSVEAGAGLRLPLNLPPQTAPVGAATTSQQLYFAAALQTALETHIDIAKFHAAEPALAGWVSDGCRYTSSVLPGNPARSALAIANAGTAKWLTAQHLLEMFGCLEQGNRLLGTGSGIEEVVTLLENEERVYTLPLLIWFSQFPTGKDQPTSSAPHTRPGELYLGFYRGFPLELLVAADLALWPPFTPEGFIGSSEIDWADINPAFRFARILNTYKSLEIRAGEWPVGELNQVIPTIQRRVCDALGWPTPSDLARRWHAHLAERDTTWFPDAAVGGFRFSTTLQLLALRRDRPGDVVVNNVDYNAHGVGRSPGWLTREECGTLLTHTLASDADRQSTEFWFGVHAIAPALSGSSAARLDFLKSCSVETRQACIEAFDIWGRAIPEWPTKEFRKAASQLLGVALTSH